MRRFPALTAILLGLWCAIGISPAIPAPADQGLLQGAAGIVTSVQATPERSQFLSKTLRATPERDRQAVASRWLHPAASSSRLQQKEYQGFLPASLAVFALLIGVGAVTWGVARRRDVVLRDLAYSLGLLAAGLLLTGIAVRFTWVDARREVQRGVEFAADEIRLNIAARLRACAQVLRSSAALFDATGSVSREQWRIFNEGLQLEQQLPGIQGVGFAMAIPRVQLAAHEQAIRREGFPEYQVRPAGARETYSSIIYLEPFSDRNLRAFGYDMLSEPVRRAAMERARDENVVALSGKVTLVQETGRDVQAGTLLYFPVYRRGLPLETVAQRRAAILGWVYSPYRMTDMLRGALRGWDVRLNERRDSFQVFDGETESADSLLFTSQVAGENTPEAAWSATRVKTVDFAGRRWTLRFAQAGGLAATAEYGLVWAAGLGGTIISVLLFWLTLSLLGTRASAQRIAERLTQEIRQSEKRFAVMADAAPVLIWESGTDKLCNYFNKTWLDFTGRTLAQEMGNGWTEGVHRDDVAHCQGVYVSAFDARREFKMEYRLRRRDGEYRWLLDHGVPRQHADGTFAGYIGSCLDITERKQAAEALQASETRLKTILENSRDAIGVHLDGSWVLCNPAAVRLFGLSAAGDLLGTSILNVIAPGERERVRNLARSRAEEADAPMGYVTRGLRADGTEFEMEVTVSKFRLEGRIHVFAILRDISERVRAEEEIQRLSREQQIILENANIGISLVRDRRQVWINDKAAKLIGYPMEKLVGQTTEMLYASPEAYEKLGREAYPVLAEGRGYETVQELVRSDGAHIWVRYNGKAINPADMSQGALWLLEDITERITQQQKLKDLLAQTERDARTKGELLREVNHRVTNNLTAVLGLMVFEQRHSRGDPQSITGALERLSQRIRGLLHVHRMLSQSSWAPVSVNELAGQIIRAALAAAQWRQAAVVTIAPSAARVSPRQAGTLAMVINELATNTVKYAHQPGAAVAIGVEAECSPEFVTVRYRDNGPGFPPEVLAKERSNLGLKLINEMVNNTLGGSVELTNDNGAVATMRFPVEEETRT